MNSPKKTFTVDNLIEYMKSTIVPTEAHYLKRRNEIINIYESLGEGKLSLENKKNVDKFQVQYAYFIKNDKNNDIDINSVLAQCNTGVKSPIVTKHINAGQIEENDYQPNQKANATTTPYLFDVWEKMLLMCDLMIREESQTSLEIQETDPNVPTPERTPEEVKNGLLADIISSKIEKANKESNNRSRKLYGRINYVMGVIVSNMIEFINNYATNSQITAKSFMEIFREEGIDIYDFKELGECAKNCPYETIENIYKHAMKGATFKVKVMTKKKEGKLYLKQKPYNSEISSYKLAMDADKIFGQDPRRNVRVSPSQDIQEIISTKHAWHMFTKINEMLTQVQVFFTYVKEMYANTTINIRNHLDTIYDKQEALAVYQKKQGKPVADDDLLIIYASINKTSMDLKIPFDSLENEMKTRMKTLSDTLFSRASARLYGLINNFITGVIQCKKFNDDDVKKFREEHASIISMLTQSVQTGGGVFGDGLAYVKNKTVNGLIRTWDGTKNLLNMINKTVGQIMRFLAELNPTVALLLNLALVGASCTMSAIAFASLNFVMGAGMARYCLMSIYLLSFTTQNMEGKVKAIHQKLGGAFDTTDIILTIMQYGAFKELHDELLERIGKMIEEDGMIEDKFDVFKKGINEKLASIKSNVSSFKEENMYIFHKRLRSKLFQIIADKVQPLPNVKIDWKLAMKNLKNIFGNKYESLQYFLNNTPISSKDLKDAIDILVGDISIDSRLFPKYFTNDQRLEMNYQVSKKFAEPDVRKFVLICLMEVFEPDGWKMPEDIMIFKKWMKGEDITCLLKKKKKLAVQPVERVHDILMGKEDSNKHSNLLLAISDLTFIEKIMDQQPILVQLRCRILEKAIQHMKDSKIEVKFGLSSRAEKNEDFGLYKKYIQELESLNEMMDYKLKHPSYTIFFMGSSNIFEKIKDQVGNEMFELYKTNPTELENISNQESILNQATTTSISDITKNADSVAEVAAQVLITIALFN